MQTIQFTLPENLVQDLEEIKTGLDDIKKNYQPKEPEDFITRTEAAKFLKISLVTVHQWANDGILHPYKMGNRTYFSRKQIVDQMYNSNKE